MLTVEINEQQQSVEIFLDTNGVDQLIATLLSIRDKKEHHAHLMTEAWGGKELDGVPHRTNRLINHLIVWSCA
jgi:hypothetical protein